MKGQKRYHEIVEYVEKRGASRLQAQGSLDDGDYLMGAAAALIVALEWNPGDLPVSWTLDLMAGHSPIDDWFVKLVGVHRLPESDPKKRIRRMQKEINDKSSRIYELTEALTEALDHLDTIYDYDGNGEPPESLESWRGTLEGKTADAETS